MRRTLVAKASVTLQNVTTVFPSGSGAPHLGGYNPAQETLPPYGTPYPESDIPLISIETLLEHCAKLKGSHQTLPHATSFR